MDIDFLRRLVQHKRYTLSRHSDTRRARRSVPLQEIEAAILGGIIIQEHPNHQPLPRCVIRSTATTRRPIEVVCDVSYEEEWLTIVTVMRGKTRRGIRRG